MNARIVAAIAAVVVLGGGSIAFVQLRAAHAVTTAREELLHAVDTELGRPEPDREEVGRLSARIAKEIESHPHADLRRAQVRLQLGLGRIAEAWDAIGSAAASPGADPDDVWLGAQVVARRFASVGNRADGVQALSLARAYAEAEPRDPAPAFLAWQSAYRIDDALAWLDTGRVLASEHAGTLEADTASMIGHFLGVHLADRLGIAGGPDRLRALADDASTGDPERALCRFVLDTADAAGQLGENDLLTLERRWDKAPPELAVLLAFGQLAKASNGTGGDDQLRDATDALQIVLDAYPTYVEARHLAATAWFGLREYGRMRAHVAWLLEHASERDVRRPRWDQLAR